MSIVLITGNHPRHQYFVNSLSTTGLIHGWIRERRENIIPLAPKNISKDLSNLFNHHFALRKKFENQFFQEIQNINLPTIEIDKENLNSKDTVSFINKIKPDLVISYGCNKISNQIIEASNCKFWNTHGGLSPWYRGVITHFWPSYFLEPQMTGLTLHETSETIDGGNILFQTSAEMMKGDGIHQLASRSVLGYIKKLKENIAQLDFKNLPEGKPQQSNGKLFKASDWRPEHLQVIYNQFDDSIVDLYLSGEISKKKPKLISVF